MERFQFNLQDEDFFCHLVYYLPEENCIYESFPLPQAILNLPKMIDNIENLFKIIRKFTLGRKKLSQK